MSSLQSSEVQFESRSTIKLHTWVKRKGKVFSLERNMVLKESFTSWHPFLWQHNLLHCRFQFLSCRQQFWICVLQVLLSLQLVTRYCLVTLENNMTLWFD